MAKRFAGFKPETFEKKILPALGYDGPTDTKSINLFLAANPAAASQMGKYTIAARQMVEGKPIRAAGGKYSSAGKTGTGIGGGYTREDLGIGRGTYVDSGDDRSSNNNNNTVTARPSPTVSVSTPGNPNPTNGATNGIVVDSTQKTSAGSKMTGAITSDPTKVATKAAVVASTGTGTNIATNTGQAGAVNQAGTSQAGPVGTVVQPTALTAQQIQAAGAAPSVTQALSGLQGAQGQVSQQAQVQAAQGDPTQLAALQLQQAQAQAAQVQAPSALQATPNQLVSGSAVDMNQAEATLQKSEAATVRDELSDLMKDFQGGNTPSWAAGAMRTATANMAARGLGASSIAGMATVQAAMEAALPIAQMDAANKQQMAMAKAEQRAKFLGMEFDQNFQTKVRNAARISEVANLNFTAEQQVALENARMTNTVNLANLDARSAKVLSDAAAMSQMDMTNLNSRQQAEVVNAQSFLEMDMANLDNDQQTSLFKAQQRVSAILSDTSAENASRQFNATSQMQTDQFMANLSTDVSRFNVEQKSAMDRFNAGESNAQSRFNAQQGNARDEFNAKNHLVVAQANAQWAQSVTTASNAAINQSNRDAALAANNLTMAAYNSVVQRERDMLAWAWKSADNAAERDANVMIANITANKAAEGGSFLSKAGSKFLATIGAAAVDKVFLKYFD